MSRRASIQAIDRGLSYRPVRRSFVVRDVQTRHGRSAAFLRRPSMPNSPVNCSPINCSPSFNWQAKLDAAAMKRWREELAALGYRFQFITLAGWHALNLSMFELAAALSSRRHARLLAAAAARVQPGERGLSRHQASGLRRHRLFRCGADPRSGGGLAFHGARWPASTETEQFAAQAAPGPQRVRGVGGHALAPRFMSCLRHIRRDERHGHGEGPRRADRGTLSPVQRGVRPNYPPRGAELPRGGLAECAARCGGPASSCMSCAWHAAWRRSPASLHSKTHRCGAVDRYQARPMKSSSRGGRTAIFYRTFFNFGHPRFVRYGRRQSGSRILRDQRRPRFPAQCRSASIGWAAPCRRPCARILTDLPFGRGDSRKRMRRCNRISAEIGRYFPDWTGRRPP